MNTSLCDIEITQGKFCSLDIDHCGKCYSGSEDFFITMQLEKKFLETVKACWEIYNRKGRDYTIDQADENRLYNFYEVAELTGQTPMQVWSVYFLKHVFAVMAFAKTGKVESEGIDGRLYDIINYAILGKQIVDKEAEIAEAKRKEDDVPF